MPRRFTRPFVSALIALLLLVQQGLALHALAHGFDALRTASHGQNDPAGLPDDRPCDLCPAYAQMGAGAAPAIATFTATPLPFAAPAAPRFHVNAVATQAYRSRAPPVLA